MNTSNMPPPCGVCGSVGAIPNRDANNTFSKCPECEWNDFRVALYHAGRMNESATVFPEEGQPVPPPVFGTWQPIETAPRDGSDIIVGFDTASVWIVHVAWWRDIKEWMEWKEEDVGWWSYTNNSVTQEKLEDYRTPTHWMPLPPLPKA